MANPQTQVREVETKVINKPGGRSDETDFSVDEHDLVADGDYEVTADDVGGASLMVVSLESAHGAFSVEIDTMDSDGLVYRTLQPRIYTDQLEINSNTVPVPADHLRIRITDASDGAQNVVSGTINIHSGGPNAVLLLERDGSIINPRSENSDHRTANNVDVNAESEVIDLTVPNRPDSVRILVTDAEGTFEVEVEYDNTIVVFDGDVDDPVDVERACMSNETCIVRINDTSGSTNTVNYDVMVV